MSSLNIHERFTLDARPSEVWSFLIDPERVVACLPGAELTARTDETTYDGAVKVSLGAVTVSYRGTAVFEEVDHERRCVRIVGRGREKSGSGTVSMTMESRVEDAEGGGAAVTVDAEVKVAGKIVRFGRGMIQSVSAEMFSEFTKCLGERVGGSGAESAGSQETEDGSGEQAADGASGRTGGERRGDRVDERRGDGVDERREGGEAARRGGGEAERREGGEAAPEGTGSGESRRDAEALAVLPLLWRSFKRWLRDAFR